MAKGFKVYSTGGITHAELVERLWLSPVDVAARENMPLHEVRRALAEDRVFPAQRSGKGWRIAPVYVIAPKINITKAQRKHKPKNAQFQLITALPDGRVRTKLVKLNHKDQSRPVGLPEDGRRIQRRRETRVLEALGRPQIDDGEIGDDQDSAAASSST